MGSQPIRPLAQSLPDRSALDQMRPQAYRLATAKDNRNATETMCLRIGCGFAPSSTAPVPAKQKMLSQVRACAPVSIGMCRSSTLFSGGRKTPFLHKRTPYCAATPIISACSPPKPSRYTIEKTTMDAAISVNAALMSSLKGEGSSSIGETDSACAEPVSVGAYRGFTPGC